MSTPFDESRKVPFYFHPCDALDQASYVQHAIKSGKTGLVSMHRPVSHAFDTSSPVAVSLS